MRDMLIKIFLKIDNTINKLIKERYYELRCLVPDFTGRFKTLRGKGES